MNLWFILLPFCNTTVLVIAGVTLGKTDPTEKESQQLFKDDERMECPENDLPVVQWPILLEISYQSRRVEDVNSVLEGLQTGEPALRSPANARSVISQSKRIIEVSYSGRGSTPLLYMTVCSFTLLKMSLLIVPRFPYPR